MNATFLSRFTPSMMTPEALEAIFVQREELAERLVELIRESALTPAKHHTLLIGPRGIGKTHLVSLIYHRLRAMEDLRDRLLIAWLREEEWGVTSFLDLLLRIFRALLAERPDATLAERVEALYSLSPEAAERTAGALLKEFVGDRALLILVENLDDLFNGLGDEGQKRLRAYLQKHQLCTMLVTAQSLFNGVALQISPFYGFFRINHLEELTLDEATRLLTNIANLEGDCELASLIPMPTGRARIRALHHLAGGNHRVYIIFSQFLNRESLDEFVEPFMRTLDDLTPYYQARMAWLSPQQRKIIEFLCDRRGAAPVKEIAQRCFMTHQTASSQLGKLLEMGYVRSEPAGRESYYELREPLMRLCVEVKKHRSDLIRLFVDFLRLWYGRSELERRLSDLSAKGDEVRLEREHILAALAEYKIAEAKEALSQVPDLDRSVRDLLQAQGPEREKHWVIVMEEVAKMARLLGRAYGVKPDDLRQDAFLKLLNWINTIDLENSHIRNYAAYTYKIVRNLAIDTRKKMNQRYYREHVLDDETVDDILKVPAEFQDPVEMAELRSEREAQVVTNVRRYLTSVAGNPKSLKSRMQRLQLLLARHVADDILAEGLLHCLPTLYHRNKDREIQLLRNWRDAAQDVLGSIDHFQIPLRLLDTAVRYRETEDRRVLLELPIEERTLLEPLLGIEESQPSSRPAGKRAHKRLPSASCR